MPFYFTPSTPMLYNVVTGYGGIRRRSTDEIAILVSSLPKLEESAIRYVFTDRHAYLRSAEFFASRDDLNRVDYDLLRRRDFERDAEDPGKLERYQAEALVHERMPASALLGIACYSRRVLEEIEADMSESPVALPVTVRQGWYFR